MINKLKVIDANYSGLNQYFPNGHELELDSNIVLLVGPNGSGKTAFLRMLATSINHERYFKSNAKEIDLDKYKHIKFLSEKDKIFMQEFGLPIHNESYEIKNDTSRTYTQFDISYDGSKVVPKIPPWLKDFTPEEEYKANEHKRVRVKSSPGQELSESLESRFEDITKFFKEHKNPTFNPKNKYDPDEFGRLPGDEWTYENVPKDNSQLVVFMDEPTAYLDYINKHKFKEKVTQFSKDYGKDLQFFITTNDPILIEKINNATFINLYQKPAITTNEILLNL